MVTRQEVAPFGRRLRESRRSRGLSQAELGGDRYTGSYISHLESGRRAAPRQVVEFLALRLGVTPLELGVDSDPLIVGVSELETVESLPQLLVAERAWHDRDWGTAAALAERAAATALESGQTVRHWRALHLQAQACAADGRYEEASGLAQVLADHEVAAMSATLRAQALSLASTAYRSCDQLALAIGCAAQAVELSAEAPPIVLADALMSLVSAMLEAGRSNQRVVEYCRRLADVSLHVESDHARGMIAWTLGTAAYRQGDPDGGRELHDRAFALINPNRDLRMWLRLRRVMASCRLDVEQVDGVGELLRVARQGLELIGNPFDLYELRHAEARLLLLQDQPEEAEALIAATLADRSLEAAVSTNGRIAELHAQVLLTLGRDAEAAEAYLVAAASYEKQDQFRLASQCWQRSFELSKTLSNHLTGLSSP